MTAKSRWVPSARALIQRMAQENEPYTTQVLDKSITVLPNVWSPKYFPDAIWFAKEVPQIVGKRSFLEIGSGTGITALFVALNGARTVAATDINPAAVRNARLNFRLHGVRVAVYDGSVFEPLKKDQRYDVIFWDHPFHYAQEQPTDVLTKGAFDYQYKNLRTFFSGAAAHLSPGGELLLGTGNVARITEIKRIAKECGFYSRLLKRTTLPPQEGTNLHRENRIYSFKLPL